MKFYLYKNKLGSKVKFYTEPTPAVENNGFECLGTIDPPVEPVKPEKKYPCYQKNNKGLIVYFTAPKRGTVVKTNTPVFSVGYTLSNWLEDCFTPISDIKEAE